MGSLELLATKDHLLLSCSVSGCIPRPVLSLSISGGVIPATSVYTSANTSTATASVILPDSAAIQCMVAVSGTNYTATVQEYYTRYNQNVMARPYTSQGGSSKTSEAMNALSPLISVFLIGYRP